MSGNVSQNEALSSRQRRFVTALLSSATIGDAAAAAGICERTAFRYLKDEAVRREIDGAMTAVFGQVVWRISRAMLEALSTLEAINKNEEAGVFARLKAARDILDVGQKLREHNDLAGRLAAIEERLGGGQ